MTWVSWHYAKYVSAPAPRPSASERYATARRLPSIVLFLAIYREFGLPDESGVVFFLARD